MKILQIGKYYPPYYGGMETTLYNLCAEFSKNHEVTVLVSNTDNKTVHEKIDGVNVIRLKRFCKIASTDICPTMFRYIEDSDIIHIHSPNPTAEVSYMAARPKGKVVITYHSDVVKQKMLGKIYSPVFNKILKKADKILATSAEYVNGSIWLSKYSEKVNIVPLGIDIKFFMNKAEDKSIEDIKNTHGNDLVLFIGRLVYYKGLEYLIKAMKGVDAKLLVIGEGPLKEHLTGLSIKEEVADRIVFLGNTSEEEKINYLSSASVFCLPSVERSEAYGIVQLEAMACGVPVINTRIQGSGIHTLSLHNETGLTVQPADPQALTNAVNTLLNDKKLAKKMGENGKLRVEKYYTKELMAKNILDIYKELLS